MTRTIFSLLTDSLKSAGASILIQLAMLLSIGHPRRKTQIKMGITYRTEKDWSGITLYILDKHINAKCLLSIR